MVTQRRILDGRGAWRCGVASAWIITAAAVAITAGLVVLFLRNLPDPPRFDDLRIEPGSKATTPRRILRRHWTSASGEPEVETVSDVRIDSWPVDEQGLPATTIAYRVPIERNETTFARFAVEGGSAAVVIRRGSVMILEVDAASSFQKESDSVVIPIGASDLDIDVIPRGASPRLRVTWREIEVDDEPRSLASLMESSGT
jgi:hypothetical protein